MVMDNGITRIVFKISISAIKLVNPFNVSQRSPFPLGGSSSPVIIKEVDKLEKDTIYDER